METKNQTAQESAQSGVVDYAAALRRKPPVNPVIEF